MSDTQLMPTRQNGAIAQQDSRSVPAIQTAAYGKNGVTFQNFAELWSFAGVLCRSGMAPKGMSTEGLAVALQLGAELGLPPMASIQNIAVINGRPSLWGDAQLAVCRATGEVEEFTEWFEHGGKKLARNPVSFDDTTTAVCRVKRKGMEPMESAFSVADAKRAKLFNKPGPWTEYPHRMLRNRARSFALRDTFGDALRGLMSSDEVTDITTHGHGVTSQASIPTGSLDDAVHEQFVGEVAGESHQTQEQPQHEEQPAPTQAKQPESKPQQEVKTSQPVATIPGDTERDAAVEEKPKEDAKQETKATATADVDDYGSPDNFAKYFLAAAQFNEIPLDEAQSLYAKLKVAHPISKLSMREKIANHIASGTWDYPNGKPVA